MRVESKIWLAIVLLFACLSSAEAQRFFSTASEPDSTGMVFGMSPVVSLVRGEPFEQLGVGPGLNLFVGYATSVKNEVRVGLALNSQACNINLSRVNLLSVYAENHFVLGINALTLRVGPRVIWLRETHPGIDRTLTGFGLGGFAGSEFSVSNRTSIEPALVATFVTLPGADNVNLGGRMDPDSQSFGAIYELRIGIAYRPN